jgi:predicted nucleic acid-binding protein
MENNLRLVIDTNLLLSAALISGLEERQRYIFGYQKTGLFVIPERHFFRCRDAKDNKFLDAAVAGNVEALITGDKDLMVLENIESIPILSMADFLKS